MPAKNKISKRPAVDEALQAEKDALQNNANLYEKKLAEITQFLENNNHIDEAESLKTEIEKIAVDHPGWTAKADALDKLDSKKINQFPEIRNKIVTLQAIASVISNVYEPRINNLAQQNNKSSASKIDPKKTQLYQSGKKLLNQVKSKASTSTVGRFFHKSIRRNRDVDLDSKQQEVNKFKQPGRGNK